MNEEYFKKIIGAAVLISLVVLSFILIRPVLLSIITGLIFAFIFSPVYDRVYKIVKSKNIAAGLICFFLLLIILTPIWFLTPIVIEQSIEIFSFSQKIDFVTPLTNIFPSLFASEQFSAEVGSIIHSFVTKLTNSLMNFLANFILNFATLFLQAVVVFFTIFFVLRDKEDLISYIKSLSPFSKDIEKKIFDSSKAITSSVIYGQFVVGIIQGLVAGLGFLIFRVPNALLLTLLASLAGIFPIIGTVLVWVPVVIYLFYTGNTFAAFGVLIFGLISSTLDNFLKPIIISRRAKMHSAIVLIAMIGGLFLFGVLGFILGPLIIAYLIILLETYRNKKTPGVFIQQKE